MASEWDTHTALTAARRRSSSTPTLDPGWVVGGGVNGGYLLGIVGNAVAETAARPSRTRCGQRLLPLGRPGPARAGRRRGCCATAAASRPWRPSSARRAPPGITALATYGDLARDARPTSRTTAVEPDAAAARGVRARLDGAARRRARSRR